jgi:hypothetical protein
MTNPGDQATTTATVEIKMVVDTVSFNVDGMADICYLRTITDTADQSVLVRDVVRVTEPMAIVYGGVADAAQTVWVADANHATVEYTKETFDKKSKEKLPK